MNLCEDTDPEHSTSNKGRGVELSVQPLLIGHKGSSYQTTAAASADAESQNKNQSEQKTESGLKKSDNSMQKHIHGGIMNTETK